MLVDRSVKPAKKVYTVLLFHVTPDINLVPKNSRSSWEVITTCTPGTKVFIFTSHVNVQAAL